MNLQPLVTTPINNIIGFQIAYAGTKSIRVSPGQCYDSTNTYYINQTTTDSIDPVFGDSTLIEINKNGINGLDIGTVEANTFYFVYVIADILGYQAPKFILSKSSNGPYFPNTTLPGIYSVYRRLGSIKTDGSSNIIAFLQSYSDGLSRTMQYVNSIQVLINGNSTTPEIVLMNGAIPTNPNANWGGKAHIISSYTPQAAGNSAFITPGSLGGISSTRFISIIGQVASVPITNEFVFVPGNQAFVPAVAYQVTSSSDSLNIYVLGYDDIL